MPESSCEINWGLCMGDPRCKDLDCRGHPANNCSTCAGQCPAPQACWQPEEQPKPRRSFLPSTREAWGRLIGALLGAGGLVLFAQDAVRQLFFHT